jgi:uncharacterized membrane protein
MKRYEAAIEIAAPPERVWSVLTDVEDWPNWTESMTTVELESPGPLSIGSRATIEQPRLGRAGWQVDTLDSGRSFTWTSRRPGIRTTGVHEITAHGGGTHLVLAVEHRGLLAGPAGAMTASLTRRYLGLEAAGLKAAAESMPRP